MMIFETVDEVLHLACFAEEKLSCDSVERHLAVKHLCQRVVWILFIPGLWQQETTSCANDVLAFQKQVSASRASAWKQ